MRVHSVRDHMALVVALLLGLALVGCRPREAVVSPVGARAPELVGLLLSSPGWAVGVTHWMLRQKPAPPK